MLISLLTCSAISALGMATVGSNLYTNFILVFSLPSSFSPYFLSSLQPGQSVLGSKPPSKQNSIQSLVKSLVHVPIRSGTQSSKCKDP